MYRKKHYIHNDRLHWDEQSSSDSYVRKHCKPLKVRSNTSVCQPASAARCKTLTCGGFPLADHAQGERGGAAALRLGQLHVGVRRLQPHHPGGGAMASVLRPCTGTDASAQLARKHDTESLMTMFMGQTGAWISTKLQKHVNILINDRNFVYICTCKIFCIYLRVLSVFLNSTRNQQQRCEVGRAIFFKPKIL